MNEQYGLLIYKNGLRGKAEVYKNPDGSVYKTDCQQVADSLGEALVNSGYCVSWKRHKHRSHPLTAFL